MSASYPTAPMACTESMHIFNAGYDQPCACGSFQRAPEPRKARLEPDPKTAADLQYERDMMREHRQDSEFRNRGRGR